MSTLHPAANGYITSTFIEIGEAVRPRRNNNRNVPPFETVRICRVNAVLFELENKAPGYHPFPVAGLTYVFHFVHSSKMALRPTTSPAPTGDSYTASGVKSAENAVQFEDCNKSAYIGQANYTTCQSRKHNTVTNSVSTIGYIRHQRRHHSVTLVQHKAWHVALCADVTHPAAAFGSQYYTGRRN